MRQADTNRDLARRPRGQPIEDWTVYLKGAKVVVDMQDGDVRWLTPPDGIQDALHVSASGREAG